MRRESWGEHKKSWLDKFIEMLRFSMVINNISGKTVLDLGCGYKAEFLHLIKDRINKGIGIDLAVDKSLNDNKINLINIRIDSKIPLKSNYFNTITSMAVIEHVEFPKVMLKEAYRLLKSEGILLITTPSINSKFILEFLAFKLHLISENEIKDHKRYYSKKSIINELEAVGFKVNKIRIKTFLGLNIYAKAIK